MTQEKKLLTSNVVLHILYTLQSANLLVNPYPTWLACITQRLYSLEARMTSYYLGFWLPASRLQAHRSAAFSTLTAWAEGPARLFLRQAEQLFSLRCFIADRVCFCILDRHFTRSRFHGLFVKNQLDRSSIGSHFNIFSKG